MAKKNSRIVQPSTPPADTTTKRKGRPAGSLREIFVVCAGLYEVDGEIQLGSEKFHVVLDKDATDVQLMAAGKKMFQERFSVEPSSVMGPFFERKGKSGYVKKRDSVRIDTDDIQMSGKSAKGVYNGWNVSINYLSNRDDVAFIMFKNEVSPGDKTKAKPPAKPVLLKSITNIA